MTDKTTIINAVKKLIAEDLDSYIKLEDITEEIPLFEDGIGLDSVNLIELITLVEKKFAIKFTDEELDPSNFSTVGILADMVVAKVNK